MTAANNSTPKSPARRQCEQAAAQQYSHAKGTALNSALKGAVIGGAVTTAVQGLAGCAVGSGVGGAIGALFGGVSAFGTAPVGCVVGGVSAALEGLPLSVAAGGITAGVTYYLDASAAGDIYRQNMQACSQIQ